MLVGGTNKKFQEITWVETGLSVEVRTTATYGTRFFFFCARELTPFSFFSSPQPQAFTLKPPEMSAYRPFKAKRKPLLEVTNDGYE